MALESSKRESQREAEQVILKFKERVAYGVELTKASAMNKTKAENLYLGEKALSKRNLGRESISDAILRFNQAHSRRILLSGITYIPTENIQSLIVLFPIWGIDMKLF